MIGLPIEKVEEKYGDTTPKLYPAAKAAARAWKTFIGPEIKRVRVQIYAGPVGRTANILVAVPEDCIIPFIGELLKDDTVERVTVWKDREIKGQG